MFEELRRRHFKKLLLAQKSRTVFDWRNKNERNQPGCLPFLRAFANNADGDYLNYGTASQKTVRPRSIVAFAKNLVGWATHCSAARLRGGQCLLPIHPAGCFVSQIGIRSFSAFTAFRHSLHATIRVRFH